MNIIRGMTFVVLTVLLVACGKSVEMPDAFTETADLEIQIVTSLADSELINRLEVVDESGEVLYVASNFVNRFHELTLQIGKTYQVVAQTDFSGLAQRGEVALTSRVTLVAANQSLVLDLRPAYTTVVLFNAGEDKFAFSIPVERNITRGSASSSLSFVEGSYVSHAILPIEAAYAHFGAGSIQWSGDVVRLTPEMFGGDTVDDVMVEVRYSDVPRINCTSATGVFSLGWENEFSQLNQRLEVSVPCKG